jgi:hypothetical protein
MQSSQMKYEFLNSFYYSFFYSLCYSGSGGCPKMSDVGACSAFAEATCGTSNFVSTYMMSDCGGHAGWHYHTSFNCALSAAYTWLTASLISGHSKLVGVLLDGRGIYGKYESASTLPSNLDACNGHYGPVPAFSETINGVTVSYPAASNVYHYHVSTNAPYTVGCFGPVTSVAAAKSLISACTGNGGTCASSDALSGNCGNGQTWTACTSNGQLTNYVVRNNYKSIL